MSFVYLILNVSIVRCWFGKKLRTCKFRLNIFNEQKVAGKQFELNKSTKKQKTKKKERQGSLLLHSILANRKTSLSSDLSSLNSQFIS